MTKNDFLTFNHKYFTEVVRRDKDLIKFECKHITKSDLDGMTFFEINTFDKDFVTLRFSSLVNMKVGGEIAPYPCYGIICFNFKTMTFSDYEVENI